jgi:hypothetical protein
MIMFAGCVNIAFDAKQKRIQSMIDGLTNIGNQLIANAYFLVISRVSSSMSH